MEPNKQDYFTEENSAEVLVGQIADTTDPRLAVVIGAITRHLHAAVKEIEPTQEEWLAAILFLTKRAQMSDDWRQEFILLSDIFGVSMLVDAINNRKPNGASESAALGAFHVSDVPELLMGSNICVDGKGHPMLIKGRILNTHGQPIEGTKIDVWQTNDDGFYDVQQKGIRPDFNLRGVFCTGADRTYMFWGAKPRFYPIPE